MSFSNISLRFPRGFASVLEGLAKEVLRRQPEDIPAFAADYFITLVKEREESGVSPEEWSAWLENRFRFIRPDKEAEISSSDKSTEKEDEGDQVEFSGDEIDQPLPDDTFEASEDADDLEISSKEPADVDICASELELSEDIQAETAGSVEETGDEGEESVGKPDADREDVIAGTEGEPASEPTKLDSESATPVPDEGQPSESQETLEASEGLQEIETTKAEGEQVEEEEAKPDSAGVTQEDAAVLETAEDEDQGGSQGQAEPVQEGKSESQADITQEPVPESETKEEKPESQEAKKEGQPQEEEDIMDIPLDDPEANKAAAKIQAGFRGHMTRKKLKPGDKPSEEVSSSGEVLNGSQGETAGGSEGVETDETSVPEQ